MKSRIAKSVCSLLGIVVVVSLSMGGVAPAMAAPQSASVTSIGPDFEVGDTARTAALSPDGRTAYVSSDEGISVFDTQTRSRTASLANSGQQLNFVLSPDGGSIYRSNPAVLGIDVFSTKTNSLIGIIPIGTAKQSYEIAISPDGKTLLAVGSYPRSLFIVDTATRQVVGTFGVGAESLMENVWISPNGRNAYVGTRCIDAVCSAQGFSVLVVDIQKRALVRTIPSCSFIRDIIFTLDAKKAYVACESRAVTVIETATGLVSKTIYPEIKVNTAVLAPNGTKLLVAGHESQSVVEIDVQTDMVSGRVGFLTPGSILDLVAPQLGNEIYALKVGSLEPPLMSKITVTNGNPSVSSDRIAGKDRYETAVAVSRYHKWVSNVVYVTTGEQFPDALSATPAANIEQAPLLLTRAKILPPVVRDEILRLKPTKVVVVGSSGAVSEAVFQQIKGMVPNTIRRGGKDRYATSRAVVTGAFSSSFGITFATGADFPDALSAAATGPVLLVRPGATQLDTDSKALLKKLGVRNAAIVGGTGVVSAGFQKSLADELLNPVRYAGKDRFETNQAVLNSYGSYYSRAYLTAGFNFPDALAISAVPGSGQGAVILVRPGCIPVGAKSYLDGLSGAQHITLLGGPTVVGDDVAFGKSC